MVLYLHLWIISLVFPSLQGPKGKDGRHGEAVSRTNNAPLLICWVNCRNRSQLEGVVQLMTIFLSCSVSRNQRYGEGGLMCWFVVFLLTREGPGHQARRALWEPQGSRWVRDTCRACLLPSCCVGFTCDRKTKGLVVSAGLWSEESYKSVWNFCYRCDCFPHPCCQTLSTPVWAPRLSCAMWELAELKEKPMDYLLLMVIATKRPLLMIIRTPKPPSCVHFGHCGQIATTSLR